MLLKLCVIIYYISGSNPIYHSIHRSLFQIVIVLPITIIVVSVNKICCNALNNEASQTQTQLHSTKKIIIQIFPTADIVFVSICRGCGQSRRDCTALGRASRRHHPRLVQFLAAERQNPHSRLSSERAKRLSSGSEIQKSTRSGQLINL